ncbi:MAG TPA: HPr family phosphocarrier protein [Candidatus Ornithospirochaeta avicola]|uniref:HPr family phosphocarrier protein n=1 Tax=Candidatus Ornithospirochaeta avicola TaxID=2840896 RepID=A0A9D1PTB9_9SPIO|nr:HPr family phosphocarrier protein [Candidatus Ornithospirochaeta avicola]
MKEFTYQVKDELGIHARPAGQLVKKASQFKSNITITAPKGMADLKRIMALMKLSVKQNDSVTVKCEGEDEEKAALELEEFFKTNL